MYDNIYIIILLLLLTAVLGVVLPIDRPLCCALHAELHLQNRYVGRGIKSKAIGILSSGPDSSEDKNDDECPATDRMFDADKLDADEQALTHSRARTRTRPASRRWLSHAMPTSPTRSFV